MYAGIEENLVGMINKFILISAFIFSSHIKAEFINLECKTQNENVDRIASFNLLIGTESRKATQILKKGQLQMDLLITDSHYEIGQYTSEEKTELIPVMKVNRDTLQIDYAKYIDLVKPIICKNNFSK
tara:strand:- start:907 stop:1290 length:384 start_codon:yes stop_codon:yes gene_type:complete